MPPQPQGQGPSGSPSGHGNSNGGNGGNSNACGKEDKATGARVPQSAPGRPAGTGSSVAARTGKGTGTSTAYAWAPGRPAGTGTSVAGRTGKGTGTSTAYAWAPGHPAGTGSSVAGRTGKGTGTSTSGTSGTAEGKATTTGACAKPSGRTCSQGPPAKGGRCGIPGAKPGTDNKGFP